MKTRDLNLVTPLVVDERRLRLPYDIPKLKIYGQLRHLTEGGTIGTMEIMFMALNHILP